MRGKIILSIKVIKNFDIQGIWGLGQFFRHFVLYVMCTRSKDTSANFLVLTYKDGLCALAIILSLTLILLAVLVIRCTLIFQVIFA